MKKIVFIVFFFSLALHVDWVNAELRGELIVSPEYPKAYDSVTFRMQSYSFDVDLALITWRVNGEVVDSGLGKKTLTIKAGGTGEITSVEAKASISKTDSITLVYNLSPQSVDLVWEAIESQVPPFYEGKALPGEGAVVRVVALPSFVENGRLVNPASVSYSWSVNDAPLLSQSGAGKQTLTTRLDYLADASVVDVVAKTISGGVARSRITIYPTATLPVFYQYDDILGLDRSYAITKRLETKKDISLKLVPYYLSKVESSDPGDTYMWSLDGLPIKTESPTLITLRPKENTYGSKKLTVTMENSKRRLQQAVAELLVVFDSR
ncbi:MAG: hypothetical protein QG653_604 [Patescibacteria group bacterium]|nr:hypothetical protein [Patescibacteria group bacterium]